MLRTYKKIGSLPIAFISLLGLGLGAYLWLRYGLMLDYGTVEEIISYNAGLWCEVGQWIAAVSLVTLLVLIIRAFLPVKS